MIVSEPLQALEAEEGVGWGGDVGEGDREKEEEELLEQDEAEEDAADQWQWTDKTPHFSSTNGFQAVRFLLPASSTHHWLPVI